MTRKKHHWEGEDPRLSFPGGRRRDIPKATAWGPASNLRRRLHPLRQRRSRRGHRARLIRGGARGHSLGDRDRALPPLGGPARYDRDHPPRERPRRVRDQTRDAPGAAPLESETGARDSKVLRPSFRTPWTRVASSADGPPSGRRRPKGRLEWWCRPGHLHPRPRPSGCGA
jgi:hypothetical protein